MVVALYLHQTLYTGALDHDTPTLPIPVRSQANRCLLIPPRHPPTAPTQCRLAHAHVPPPPPSPFLTLCDQVYNFNVPTFGPGVVYDVDQKVRTEQFRFFTEALKKERLKKYVPQFVMEAEVSGGWGRKDSGGRAGDGRGRGAGAEAERRADRRGEAEVRGWGDSAGGVEQGHQERASGSGQGQGGGVRGAPQGKRPGGSARGKEMCILCAPGMGIIGRPHESASHDRLAPGVPSSSLL